MMSEGLKRAIDRRLEILILLKSADQVKCWILLTQHVLIMGKLSPQEKIVK